MSRPSRLEPAPGVIAYDRQELPVDLESLRGRSIKRTLRKEDGSVVAIVDLGHGQEGLPVRFVSGKDFEACRKWVEK